MTEPMKVLAACEESQVVCNIFRDGGHEAYSCDVLPTRGDHPEWHIRCDVLALVPFESHEDYSGWLYEGGWDLIIAFVPCTDLAVSGARWFKFKNQKPAIDFFMLFANYPFCPVAIENPIGIMSTLYRKPDQIIQPWQFGHGETKATCLWLKNLPKLIPTNIVEGREQRVHRMAPGPNRARDRAETFPGIARAMADRWGDLK